MISLQYNPKTLQRSYEPQAFGEGNEPLRLKGPAVETLTIEADIDAADYLEFPDQHRDTVEHGIQPQLAALEAMAVGLPVVAVQTGALADLIDAEHGYPAASRAPL